LQETSHVLIHIGSWSFALLFPREAYDTPLLDLAHPTANDRSRRDQHEQIAYDAITSNEESLNISSAIAHDILHILRKWP
jgi:hypothetical protein